MFTSFLVLKWIPDLSTIQMLKLTCFLPCILENDSTKMQEANGKKNNGKGKVFLSKRNKKLNAISLKKIVI